MKSNTFNYSLLAVGVAAVMGLSTGANAATPATAATAGAAPISNVATANYSVAGIPQRRELCRLPGLQRPVCQTPGRATPGGPGHQLCLPVLHCAVLADAASAGRAGGWGRHLAVRPQRHLVHCRAGFAGDAGR